jgi:hypothetical protein
LVGAQYNRLGLEFEKVYNQNGLSLELNSNFENGVMFSWYILGADWISPSEHNPRKTDVSYLNIATFGVVSLTCFPAITNRDKYKYVYFILVPAIASNFRVGYRFWDTDISESSALFSSVFFRSKLDYFSSNAEKYWRYSPSLSLSLAYNINQSTIELNAGVGYQLDFLKHGKSFSKAYPRIGISIFPIQEAHTSTQE